MNEWVSMRLGIRNSALITLCFSWVFSWNVVSVCQSNELFRLKRLPELGDQFPFLILDISPGEIQYLQITPVNLRC